MRKEERTALLCESCEFSMTCMKLDPCRDCGYVPAKNSNFYDDRVKNHVLHRSLQGESNIYFNR